MIYEYMYIYNIYVNSKDTSFNCSKIPFHFFKNQNVFSSNIDTFQSKISFIRFLNSATTSSQVGQATA